MRAKDLKLVAEHIVEKLGENAEVLMMNNEGGFAEPEFFKRFRNDGDIVKPLIVEDGCIITPGVKAKL